MNIESLFLNNKKEHLLGLREERGKGYNSILTPKEYFITFYNIYPSVFTIKEVSVKFFDVLLNRGWKKFFINQIIDDEVEKIPPLSSDPWLCRNGVSTYWVKDKFFLNITAGHKREHIDVEISCPCTLPYDDIKDEIEFIKSFRSSVDGPEFSLLAKNDYCVYTKNFNVNLPSNFSLKYNFGNDFFEVHKKIKQKILNGFTGLFLLHGPPGCGKSTYIKYLSSEFKDKQFIYVPEFMIDELSSSETISHFMELKNVILVIEDAEKLLKSREQDLNSCVSLILNLTDGILSDIFRCPVIMTYNMQDINFDEALFRKGRLKYSHYFRPLTLSEAENVLKNNKYTQSEIEDLKQKGKLFDQITITDIFNAVDDVGKEPPKSKKVPLGFGG